VRRVALVKRTRDLLLYGVGVQHREAPDTVVADANVHDAPCAQVGERHPGHCRQGRLIVERRREAAADLRHERESIAARLRGVALALGDAPRRAVTLDGPRGGRVLSVRIAVGVAQVV
jgi:hypothetical protein